MRLRAGFVLASAALLGAAFPAACGGGGGGSGARSPAPAPPVPFRGHASSPTIAFANGFAAGAYNLADRRIDTFRDHVYAKRSPTETSKDFCHDLYFGWRRDGASQWLPQALDSSVGYVPGTGIVKVVTRAGGLAFETYYFAPMTGGADRAMVAVVRARNEGPDATDCSLFALMNFKLGGDGDAAGEWAFYDPQAPNGPYLMEGKAATGNRIVYKPIGAVPTHSSYAAAGPDSPFSRVAAGQHLVDPAGPLNADDIACGFEWQIAGGGRFAAGAEAWAGFVVGYGDDGTQAGETALKQAAAGFVGTRSPEEVLAREIGWWQTWHQGETLSLSATPEEVAIFRQSTAILKMAQVREPGAPEGQILASLPPGQWNICWPRDAAYAIAALARAGHHAEAREGLEFFLNGTADQFRAEVGRRYKISVCRYFGNGLEESDDNGHGPNVELDNFGLFLWALAEYVERSGDGAFLATHYAVVRDEVADVLVACLEPSGLVKADSSIWERHLVPGPNSPDGKKRFAYTSINAANGLARAAALATRAGDPGRAASWSGASARIAAAIESGLRFPDGALASSVEELALGRAHGADASVIEAVNHGLYRGSSATAAATFAYLERELRAFPLHSPGFLRCDDARHYGPDNWYDRQEWVVIDLRAVSALARMNRRADARVLLDWVTSQSAANFGVVAELYDELSADYRGAVPMVGFGAGAYLLALDDYYNVVPN